jgi:hypothetical protein
MASVNIRHGHSVDDAGLIHYDEEISSHEHAEKIAGRKLDRRKSYAIIDGQVCESFVMVRSCSGCCELGDYGSGSENYKRDPKHDCLIGMGCEECGYTGKRRDGSWMPIDPPTD